MQIICLGFELAYKNNVALFYKCASDQNLHITVQYFCDQTDTDMINLSPALY